MRNPVADFFSGLVAPVANIFTKREERKIVKEQAKGKLALAKTNNEKEITLTDQEWESISASKQDTTWKDEYVTVIGTSPYLLIIVGAVLAAFGYPAMLAGAKTAISELNEIGVDVGHITEVVVYSALGLKLWRGR